MTFPIYELDDYVDSFRRDYSDLLSAEREYLLSKIYQESKELRKKLKDGMTIQVCNADKVLHSIFKGLEAREELVLHNLRLVIHTAKKIPGVDFVSFKDAIQEGNLGLLKAVEHYNPQEHNTRFSTYATWWIKQYVRRYLATQKPLYQIPAGLPKILGQYQDLLIKWTITYGRSPSISEVQHSLNITEKMAEAVIRTSKPVVSLDKLLERTDIILDNYLADNTDIENEILDQELADLIDRLLLAIPKERDRCIVKEIYGLDDKGEPRTLEAVGMKHGLTRERIRQIRDEALRTMKSNIDDLDIEEGLL